MKKRLNLFCLCVIAAFLLSVSGNVQMIVRIFINGFEIGMKAAEEGGEMPVLPAYKQIHTMPTDLTEVTGTVTNLKDGSQLAIKPLVSLVECPSMPTSSAALWEAMAALVVIVGFIYTTVYFCKLIVQINRNIVFDWTNVKYLRRIGWGLIAIFFCAFVSVWITNYQLSQVVALKGTEFNLLLAFSDPTFILGFIALLAAEVFALGLRLKEENDLTI
ncbi:DUF2975 domain-containing protein [Phocaeicola barnesiae]|uniref:DUF2975 domain-containing protein n=1 Tax=Phocaeicola barnesiae TaxID=376804 RepID=A0AAW5N6G7_9BACT|nr:DUF2975 domain-containing protein [Phocaeicola barnesiae]MCR8873428.1 DUF2975 domain-containing protein [Phocaeicola barnesiae]MDM8240979.1 DUF2975 domain-containing protein [Phocaeicola barnesiae]